MDLVYKLSDWPVTLLGRSIPSEDVLNLLAEKMTGGLLRATRNPYPAIMPHKRQEVRKAIHLLHDIISDL